MRQLGGIAMIAILAAISAAVAEPYDAKATFHSDSVLRNALEDIAGMQEPELRAFTHYLAECSGSPIDESSKHACLAAQQTYEIEFRNKRAVDDLIDARSLVDSTPPDANFLNDPKQVANEAIKYAKIMDALERAARDRFRSLKQK